MSERRTTRLVRRALHRRFDGTMSRRTRQAWPWARSRADWDPEVREALRTEWLRDPRDATWEVVSRWVSPDDILAAGADPDRDATARARIGRFCLRHDIVPDNQVERAVFLLLTGQPEQHRALDPDGSLLAAAYRGASGRTRDALRAAMVDAGGLDMVRVIADRPDRLLVGAEADYVVGQLAGARDWEGLWRTIPTLRPVDAVRAAHRITGWRPPDGPGRAYLDRLAGADPDDLAQLPVAGTSRIETSRAWRPTGPESIVSFAPDNSEIALGDGRTVRIVALPEGRVVEGYDQVRHERDILALGDATTVSWCGTYPSRELLRRSPGHGPEILLHHGRGDFGADIQLAREGFFTSDRDGVFHGTATGPLTRAARVVSGQRVFSVAAADPVSGNVMVKVLGEPAGNVLVDAEFRVLASIPGRGFFHGEFVGPEAVLFRNGIDGPLRLRRRDETGVVRTAATTSVLAHHRVTVPREPARHLIAVNGVHGLAWLDPDTLTPVTGPPGFPAKGVRMKSSLPPVLPASSFRTATFSADGSTVAVVSGRECVVHDLGLAAELAELAERPLVRMTAADMTTLVGLPRRPLPSRAGVALELLRAGLEYRFGREVALGSGPRVASRSDDIAMGGPA